MQYDVNTAVKKAVLTLPSIASPFKHTDFRHKPSHHCASCLREVVENAVLEAIARSKTEASIALIENGIDEKRVKTIIASVGKGQALGRPKREPAPVVATVG